MKLKLIESGKFSGVKKTCEQDLTALPHELQKYVEHVFSGSASHPAQAIAQSVSRDKESYHIEYNGISLPVKSIMPNKDLDKLIEKMKAKLNF